MKVKYWAAGLTAVALLAAGCNSNSGTSTNSGGSPADNSGFSYNQQKTGQTPTNGTAGQEQYAQPGNNPAVPRTVNFNLSALNNSGERGTATLVDTGTSTVVTIAVTGEPKGASQPAHIHIGSCPGVGAVKYPLSNVVNGKSVTTVKIPLATILAGLPLAVNVHKSAALLTTYMACGPIPAQ